ncbi:MAG: hypothetical protein KC994_20335 [Candidatus Omnitrophica bacterium]|nr:hypothetical protein [Candidatus Omnitrophota bacterium]
MKNGDHEQQEHLFGGFAPPTSNTTYTPNQFFDFLIPYSKKTGVIRAVGYILRQQLGWCDAEGNPKNPVVRVSYRQLEEKAGIGHTQIRQAIDAGIEGDFIDCVEAGRSCTRGEMGGSATYQLKWNHEDGYTTSPIHFQGFYSRQGNRTFIPNQFFDEVIPNESLAVIKVVAAIIRNTIGWRNQFGFQRQQVSLSVTELERKTNLSRRALRLALNKACEKNYVERVDRGFFDPNAGRESRAAVYRLRWSDGWTGDQVGMEGAPDCTTGDRSQMDHGENEERSRKYHGGAPELTTEERSHKYHGIKRKKQKNILKRKTTTDRATKPEGESVVADDFDVSFDLLLERGFSKRDAARLAGLQSVEVIRNQIEWLPDRNPESNELGMLRRAIEENWSQPAKQKLRTSVVFAARVQESRSQERTFREKHQKMHEKSYLDYLREREDEIRTRSPERYQAFRASHGAALQSLSKPGFYEPSQTILDRMNSEESRLKSFAEFFQSKAGATEKKLVLDFWEWDKRINPYSFRGRGENP